MSFSELTERSYRVVDLTKTLSTEMSVWPGDVEPHFREVSNLADDGVNLTEIGVSLHTGTHIDAPRHFVEGGETIDKLPLHNLLGRAVIYRVPGEPEGQKLRLDEVISSGVEVNRGDIFIAATGLGTLENDPDYYRKFPVPAKNCWNGFWKGASSVTGPMPPAWTHWGVNHTKNTSCCWGMAFP
ncbi:MAG: cyclase family protein [Candidatus Acetothermia bacterium]